MLNLTQTELALLGLMLVIILILSFTMLISKWIKNYINAYALQAWLLGGIALLISIHTGKASFYILAIISVVIRGIILPYIFKRSQLITKNIREDNVHYESASMAIICVLFIIFSAFVSVYLINSLNLPKGLNLTSVIGLTSSFSMFLIGFFMLCTRHIAISKVIALMLIENGTLIGSITLVPSVIVFVSIMIVFDLFVAVISFHILTKFMMEQWQSSDNRLLTRLTG